MQQVKAPALTAHHIQTREDGGHIMQVKTKVKAGLGAANHNQTLVRDQHRATADTRPRTQRQPLKVKTQLKAGAFTTNHNQTLVRATAKPR
jgi:hypothetical protein